MLKLFRDRRTLPIAVFAVGALSLIAYGRTHRTSQGVGRTIRYRQTWTANDGTVRLDAETVEYARSDGFWKATVTYYNSDGSVKTVDLQFGSPEKKASFQIDEKRKLLVLRGPIYRAVNKIDMATARRDPSFVREDSVLGYPVAVYRFPQGDKDYDELYRSLDLDDFLRTIHANPLGYTTIEAVSIVLGEPTAEQLKVPEYPVSFDFYKWLIRQTEEQGDKEWAATMRVALAELEKTLR